MICRLVTPNLQCLMLILLSSFWLFRVYDLQNISNVSILTIPSLTRSYCWIHGTAYVRPQLQGKATGCFVDQSKLESEEVGEKYFHYEHKNIFVPMTRTPPSPRTTSGCPTSSHCSSCWPSCPTPPGSASSRTT